MKTKRFGWLGVAGLIWASSGWASSGFDFGALRNLIETNDVKTVNELVPLLPERMRRNALFVYDSHALKTHLVTPESPRVILFNEDSSLILALTRNPGAEAVARGEDTLEIISMNPSSHRYEMRDLEFNGKANPFAEAEPEVNPPLCSSCHGANPRPIFEAYNAWPGLFGSFSQKGGAAAGTPEYAFIKRFLAEGSKNDRYRELDYSSFVETEAGITIGSKDTRFSPILEFGRGVQRNLEFTTASRLLSHPQFDRVNHLLAYLGTDLDSCAPIRERIKDIYAASMGEGGREEAGHAVLEKIRFQALQDYERRKAAMDRYNTSAPGYDPRGVLTLFYYNLIMEEADDHYVRDRLAFENLVVLTELISKFMGLESATWSTTNASPTLGVGHVARGGLYKDEQMIMGVTEAIRILNPAAMPIILDDCIGVREHAIAQAKALPAVDPSADGVFYRNTSGRSGN